jgi:hypothetical protein
VTCDATTAETLIACDNDKHSSCPSMPSYLSGSKQPLEFATARSQRPERYILSTRVDKISSIVSLSQ